MLWCIKDTVIKEQGDLCAARNRWCLPTPPLFCKLVNVSAPVCMPVQLMAELLVRSYHKNYSSVTQSTLQQVNSAAFAELPRPSHPHIPGWNSYNINNNLDMWTTNIENAYLSIIFGGENEALECGWQNTKITKKWHRDISVECMGSPRAKNKQTSQWMGRDG